MTYFKNVKYKILVTIDDDGRRAVFNNGIRFTAPDWYSPAFAPIEEITENEYRYIAASGDWQQPVPARNDATMYNDWD
jgi:hypothetical protein